MTILLVDGNNLGMAAHFAFPELTDPYGRQSGMIYGFLRSLRPIMVRAKQENEALNVIVAWDGGESWRMTLFPEYKATRKETQQSDPKHEEFMQRYIEQLPRLRAILPILGVSQIRASHIEADDIAGMFVRTMKNEKIVLVTNDKDWLQLVNDRVCVWQTLKKEFVTQENFTEVTGCTDPEQYVRMMALVGDKDEVPGCDGIGPSFALKYLNGQLTKGKKYDAIKAWEENPDGYERSLRLADLRHIHFDPSLLQLTPGKLDRRAFMDTCIEYGFNSLLTKFSSWLEPYGKAA